jgi:hypothetical protein
MSPEAIRWVKVAGGTILIAFFGEAIVTWARGSVSARGDCAGRAANRDRHAAA